MKKILLVLFIIILSSCGQNPKENNKTSLAPLESPKKVENSFSLAGQNYKLPLKYSDFTKSGIKLVENDYYKETLNKDEQLMVNFSSANTDFGGSFKNNSEKKIPTKDALITEIYINSALNNDFEINGLRFGDDYSKAMKLLDDYYIEEASTDKEKSINYQTKNDYVSLYFSDDKLVSAAIFSKDFMRDKSYVEGEFVVFGQSVKFPETIAEIEELLGANFDADTEDKIIAPNEEYKIKLHSPFLKDENANDIEFVIKNTNDSDVAIKDGQIAKITSDQSLDLSIGNIFLSQGIDELKKIDKQNQNPQRMSIGEKNKNGQVSLVFDAGNNTQYVFYTDGKAITKIDVINKTL